LNASAVVAARAISASYTHMRICQVRRCGLGVPPGIADPWITFGATVSLAVLHSIGSSRFPGGPAADGLRRLLIILNG